MNKSQTENKEVLNRAAKSTFSNLYRVPALRLLGLLNGILVARFLGPASLAIYKMVGANSIAISTFFDFGLTKLPDRLLPDISAKFGVSAANQVAKKLLVLKVMLILVGYALFVLLFTLNVLTVSNYLDSKWSFLSVLLIYVVISSMLDIRKEITVATLKLDVLAKYSILTAIVTPVLTILVAMLFENPYWTALASLSGNLILLWVLYRRVDFDLNLSDEALSEGSYSMLQILKTYWKYNLLTYTSFLLRKFVFNYPFAILILTYFSIDSSLIGNGAVSFALVTLTLDIINVPISSVRGPLLSYAKAKENLDVFKKIQYFFFFILGSTSVVVFVFILFIAQPILLLLYGQEFLLGVNTGVYLAAFTISIGLFSLGNSALKRVDEYKPVWLAQILGVITLIILIAFFSTRSHDAQLVIELLFSLMIGRGVIWFVSDLVADKRFFLNKIIFMKYGLALLLMFTVYLHFKVVETDFLGTNSILIAIGFCLIGFTTIYLSFRFFLIHIELPSGVKQHKVFRFLIKILRVRNG